MISWKEDYPEEAKQAFHSFCYRFEDSIKKIAEKVCNKWDYNEVIALDIVKCTLAKVWKYPTYDHEKSNSNSIEKGIVRWLSRTALTQLANYHKKGTCHEPDQETDLSLVYTLDELIDKKSTSATSKADLKQQLRTVESIINSLNPKHKIIYLTYKLYEQVGTYIPKSVREKLQEELELTQSSIRKYKEEAIKEIQAHLKKENG